MTILRITTPLDVVQAINEYTISDAEVVATVTSLSNSTTDRMANPLQS